MSDLYYKRILLALSMSGLLFSGYLSAVKLFTSTCALNEPCPYFLGYPSCWYGFAMFLTLFILSLVAFSKTILLKSVVQIQTLVSGLGILFAGYFTVPEIERLLSGGSFYTLGLPTCAYGLIFYTIIFSLSVWYLIKNKSKTL